MGTGCGRQPQSAERMEELVESVWSVVRQGNEDEDQWEGVQDSGKTGTDVWQRHGHCRRYRKINWMSQK